MCQLLRMNIKGGGGGGEVSSSPLWMKDVSVALFRCHLCSGCRSLGPGMSWAVGSEDHVVRSLCAACDMSADPTSASVSAASQGAITQER